MRRLDYIAHHGILGMKWGIRRTPGQLGHHVPIPRKLKSGKTGDYKNDGQTVKQTYGKTQSRLKNHLAASKYNYKESDSYKKASGRTKVNQDFEYRENYRRFGRRAANRIEYKSRVQGQSRDQSVLTERDNRRLRNSVAMAGIFGSKYAYAQIGRTIIDRHGKEIASAAIKKVPKSTAAKAGLAATGAVLATYGSYRIRSAAKIRSVDRQYQKRRQAEQKSFGANNIDFY